MRLVTALALFAAGAAVILATGRPATSNPPQTITGAALPVVVPYYGATYGQPAGFSPAEARRVVELLESIDARLARLEAGGVKQAAKIDPLPVAARRCAGCHTPKAAEQKGGGFILFADDRASALKPLNAREKTRVAEAVLSGAMPPNAKLTPGERSAFEW